MLGVWLWFILIFTICTVTVGGWPFFFFMLVFIPVMGFLGALIQQNFFDDIFSKGIITRKTKTVDSNCLPEEKKE